MHHHTKFGQKRLSGSGDIVRTKSDTRADGQTGTMIPICPTNFVTEEREEGYKKTDIFKPYAKGLYYLKSSRQFKP